MIFCVNDNTNQRPIIKTVNLVNDFALMWNSLPQTNGSRPENLSFRTPDSTGEGRAFTHHDTHRAGTCFPVAEPMLGP